MFKILFSIIKMNIVEVKNLTYSYYEGNKVLDGVSFPLKEGSYTCLIGHNGSGKSTLAKVLMGLNNKFQGEITIFGLPLNHENLGKIRSKMGIVFQNPDNQFVGTSVCDDIAFGLENRQVPHEEMQSIIETYAKEVGMADFLNASPDNLSGGQKQRVAIAGVLAMKPNLIIYDEATSMLDPKGKREILSLTQAMKKENPSLTILSITHDVEEAAKADRVLVLNEGKIVLEGTPNDVFSNIEILKQCHLATPFFFEFREALKKEGFDIPPSIRDLASLEDYLCK